MAVSNASIVFQISNVDDSKRENRGKITQIRFFQYEHCLERVFVRKIKKVQAGFHEIAGEKTYLSINIQIYLYIHLHGPKHSEEKWFREKELGGPYSGYIHIHTYIEGITING